MLTATVRDEPGEPKNVGGDEGQVVVPDAAMQTRPVACAFATGRTDVKSRADENSATSMRKFWIWLRYFKFFVFLHTSVRVKTLRSPL